jgi:hypothetical protein
MNRVKISGLAALALLALSSSGFAHHGTAGNYDQTKVVKVDGVVKEFWWRNPHSALFIDGKSDAGTQGTYVLEMGAPKALVDLGYTRTTFKPGDHVVVRMHPSFGHPENGEMMQEQYWVNGKELHSTKVEE